MEAYGQLSDSEDLDITDNNAIQGPSETDNREDNSIQGPSETDNREDNAIQGPSESDSREDNAIHGPSESDNREDNNNIKRPSEEDRESTPVLVRPAKRRYRDLTASQRRQEAEDHWYEIIACAERDFEARRRALLFGGPFVESSQTDIEALTGRIISEAYTGAEVERLRRRLHHIDVTVQTIVTGDFIQIKK